MSQVPSTNPEPAKVPAPTTAPIKVPARKLVDFPKDELIAIAEKLGIDPTRSKTREDLAEQIDTRRRTIDAMDREAMLDVVRWARRPVSVSATKEQLAHEIALVKSMRFDGLSQRGLLVLARMRGVVVLDTDPEQRVIRRLKRQEGLFAKMARKRRAWIGGMISSMLGEDESGEEYRYLPPQPGDSSSSAPRSSVRDEIEEQGVLGGLANRVKGIADSYLNQKLDEIEARIDRKLEEIDKRLAEWRDKEVANRLKILKITLWVSVIVAIISLIYSYIQVYI